MARRTVTTAIEAHIAKIDSKLDAHGAEFDVQAARFDALESKLDTLRATIVWDLAALGLWVVALRLFS